MTEQVLRLTGVGVSRGGAPLLDAVSWTVHRGDRWVVLGANGAGKTTLLQVASGAVVPTEGRVELFGEPLADADLDELLPRVGWASAALADRLPAAEPVLDVVLTAAYAALTRGAEPYDDVDEQRARRVLTQLGCRTLVDRPFGTLSEGERKRVQIARALMADPELLLLDEPAAGLDLGGREALVRQLARLAADRSAPTLVLVTHHVEEIPPGFTHALLLRGGRALAIGPVDEVMTGRALSACFGLPLRMYRHEGRFTARVAFSPPR